MLNYDPGYNIQDVVLVGCGGTGAQVARTLARIVFMMADSGKSVPKLRFVDPDIIETKNIGRQLFTSSNIGMYKSVELARRFNYALGLEIEAIVEPFNHREHIRHAHSTVIIGAVDNWRCSVSQLLLRKGHKMALFSKLLHQKSQSNCSNPA